MYFKSVWIGSEGLTLCVDRDLKQNYSNFVLILNNFILMKLQCQWTLLLQDQ